MLKRIAIAFVVLLIVAAAGGVWLRQRLVTPYRAFSGEEVFVDLPNGAGVAGIAERLAAAGVVPDAWTFRIAARLAGTDRHLKAGEYRFAAAATPGEVIARLARGDVYTRPVTFPEGLTIAEMAVIFEHSGLGTADAFTRAASDGTRAARFDPDASTLEGYLFPDTYAMPRHAGAEGTVEAMLQRFEHAFDATVRADATAQHMSPREVVTLASIIEKETARADERPLVSAVYRNRLKIGMALQCDPTVIYARLLAGTWNGNLTHQDLQMNSPYNTYRFPGLPPGPIAAPGRASIDAALHPADVPYLYFVSRNDGTHVFATTAEEHNRNVQKYQIRYFKGR